MQGVLAGGKQKRTAIMPPLNIKNKIFAII